jgi:hypothetical protein
VTTVAEALNSQRTQFGADLKAGLDALSLDQTLTFTLYVKLVLPTDGFVFWVRADLVSPSALLASARLGTVDLAQAPRIVSAAPTLTVEGSLHYASDIAQTEEDTVGVNRVIFTSESEIQDLNEVSPTAMYVCTFDPQNGERPITFAFSHRESYYQQSGLYHYVGNALYSDMQTQLVNSINGFDAQSVIVSDSLPIWLSLNKYQPPYGGPFGNPNLPLFPSFLMPDNLAPPYASVHVIDTTAIQAAPYIDRQGNHWQLMQDRVRITTYGVRNNGILDFIDCVNQYTLDTDNMGIMNLPAVRDEKKPQPELRVIAQKKSIDYEVSYYQTRSRDLALKFIAQSLLNFEAQDYEPVTVTATFLGYIVDDVLIVAQELSGHPTITMTLEGPGIASDTVITGIASGTAYYVSPSQTVAPGTITGTASQPN